MEFLPPKTESEITSVNVAAKRVVEQFQARRPGIVFILTAISAVFLCITIGSLLERNRLSASISEATTQLSNNSTELKRLAAEFDGIRVQQAALKAEYDDGTSLSAIISKVIRSFVDGATLGKFAERGMFTESKNFEDWTKELNIRDATQHARASQIELDVKALAARYDSLAATRATLRQDFDRQGVRRNWCFALTVCFGLFAIATSRTRPGEIIVTTLYSVATSFRPVIESSPAPQLLKEANPSESPPSETISPSTDEPQPDDKSPVA